jgi:hypothetical protein
MPRMLTAASMERVPTDLVSMRLLVRKIRKSQTTANQSEAEGCLLGVILVGVAGLG